MDRCVLVAAPQVALIYEVAGRLQRPDRRLHVKLAPRVALASAWLKQGQFDAVLVAPELEDGDGVEVLRLARRMGAAALALWWRGGWSEPSAEALELAADCVVLPDEWWRLGVAIERAIRRTADHRVAGWPRVGFEPRLDDLIAVAPAMRSAVDRATRWAASRRPLIIVGEAGTGRGTLARAIHRASPAGGRPLAVLPALAWPDELLDDALEGLVPTSVGGRAGCWEAGTLLIEELCHLTRPRQDQLLRRLKAAKEPPRLIATCHVDPRGEKGAGRLIPELGSWLETGGRIELPPLSERAPGDRAALAGLFLGLRASGCAFGSDALEWIAAQPWPGNLPELVGFVEAVVVSCPAEVVGLVQLPGLEARGREEPFAAPDSEYQLPWEQFWRNASERFEADYFQRLIRECRGRIERCAQWSGLSRKSVSQKLTRHGIDKSLFRRPAE
jgi:DNA-binding NtrC family response regulator